MFRITDSHQATLSSWNDLLRSAASLGRVVQAQSRLIEEMYYAQNADLQLLLLKPPILRSIGLRHDPSKLKPFWFIKNAQLPWIPLLEHQPASKHPGAEQFCIIDANRNSYSGRMLYTDTSLAIILSGLHLDRAQMIFEQTGIPTDLPKELNVIYDSSVRGYRKYPLSGLRGFFSRT